MSRPWPTSPGERLRPRRRSSRAECVLRATPTWRRASSSSSRSRLEPRRSQQRSHPPQVGSPPDYLRRRTNRHWLARRHRSTERGAKTATMPTHQLMAVRACEAAGPPSSSGRTALTAERLQLRRSLKAVVWSCANTVKGAGRRGPSADRAAPHTQAVAASDGITRIHEQADAELVPGEREAGAQGRVGDNEVTTSEASLSAPSTRLGRESHRDDNEVPAPTNGSPLSSGRNPAGRRGNQRRFLESRLRSPARCTSLRHRE
jgi:hypothetical protein